jgi:hypothetical protein
MRNGIFSAGIALAMTAGAMARTEMIEIAQNDSSPAQTSKVLNAAKAGGQAESAQVAREQKTDGPTLEGLAQQAQHALAQSNDTAQQNRLAADGKKLEDTLKTLSPEAQKLLTQSNTLPAMRAPDPDAAASAVKAAPAVPAPAPKAAAAAADEKKGDSKPGEPPAKKDDNVHITSQGAAYFDSKEAIGVFTDDVQVNHPGFVLYCEQLEVYMLKDDEKKKMQEEQEKKKLQQQPPAAKPAAAVSTAGTPALVGGAVLTSATAARTANPDEVAPAGAPVAQPATAAADNKEPQPDQSIRQAIARGPKVVIIKNTETGEQQIGVCRTATYVGENGDIILRDMPLVQRGNHVHYATDPSTYMIIKQDGKMHTFGPAKVDIIEEKEKKPAAPTATAAPATPPPPGPAKPAKPGPAKPPGAPKKGKL